MAAKLAINGGEKACTVQWPSWPVWHDEQRRALNEVLESGQWWYGQKVKEFEQRFAAFQDARFGVTASSGSTALEAALLGLGIQAGDEVIIPPYTFMATASAVVRVNAVPVFADIQAETLCIDPGDVERKITGRTRGIIPVHLAGYVADMDRLSAIAEAHNLFVLEDACHSWGSKWGRKGTGALGDCGAFSFQHSKNITAAEGGIVLTDKEELAETIRSYTNCGRMAGKPWYHHEILGSNLRMTEFQAALLLAQLPYLQAQTLKRQANAKILDEGLQEIPGMITMRPEPRMTRRAYHLYAFRIDERVTGISRDNFVKALTAEGVPASPGYTTPLYKYGFFRHGADDDSLPVAPRAKQAGRGCKPFCASEVDYAGVCCPVCEEVCATTVWLKHTMLLAEADDMSAILAAVRKVCENVEELTQCPG